MVEGDTIRIWKKKPVAGSDRLMNVIGANVGY